MEILRRLLPVGLPADNQEIRWTLAKDTNASIWVISGAWSVPLFLSGRAASAVRPEAARLQRIEQRFLKTLLAPQTRARVRIITLADFIDAPMEMLQAIIDGNMLFAIDQAQYLQGYLPIVLLTQYLETGALPLDAMAA